MKYKQSAVDLTDLAIGIVVLGIVVSIGATILLNVRDTSTGQNIEVTITKNQLNTSAEAILLPGELKRLTSVTNVSFTPSDQLGIKFTSVGSNNAGAGLQGVLFIL